MLKAELKRLPTAAVEAVVEVWTAAVEEEGMGTVAADLGKGFRVRAALVVATVAMVVRRLEEEEQTSVIVENAEAGGEEG